MERNQNENGLYHGIPHGGTYLAPDMFSDPRITYAEREVFAQIFGRGRLKIVLDDFSRATGLSKTASRKAIKTLEELGLIVEIHNDGRGRTYATTRF